MVIEDFLFDRLELSELRRCYEIHWRFSRDVETRETDCIDQEGIS